jgi:hypothetical protein
MDWQELKSRPWVEQQVRAELAARHPEVEFAEAVRAHVGLNVATMRKVFRGQGEVEVHAKVAAFLGLPMDEYLAKMLADEPALARARQALDAKRAARKADKEESVDT